MEKNVGRTQYLNKLPEICSKIELNEDLMNGLRNHEYFEDCIQTIEKFSAEESKKLTILLGFASKRKSCEAFIQLLRESNQENAAQILEEYNKTQPLIFDGLSTQTIIPVMRATVVPVFGSLYYPMDKKPRGKFVSINNEPLIRRETQRFQYIFGELDFEVNDNIYYNLRADQIKDKLIEISKDQSLAKDDALIVMIVSHGEDEGILGIDYIRGTDKSDWIKMSDIVDIFSERNCKQLDRKPKIFIFDCCRIKELKSADLNWDNQNSDTFIIYSCSEGYESHSMESFFIRDGITAFGQAFSHAIARYACEESLQAIINRTNTLMGQLKNRWNYSAPECRGQCVGRDVIFNVVIDKKKCIKDEE